MTFFPTELLKTACAFRLRLRSAFVISLKNHRILRLLRVVASFEGLPDHQLKIPTGPIIITIKATDAADYFLNRNNAFGFL